MSEQPKSMDDIMALCKRRGFVYPASEIYGGLNGFWDYGPLGAQLKKNLRDAWWQDVVMNPCWGRSGPNGRPVEIVPVDTSIVQNPKVWAASGHVGGFNDPMVDDRETKQRFRADHLVGIGILPGDYTVADAERDVETLGRAADPRRIPDHTVVASTVGDAIQQLLNEKPLQRLLGIKSPSVNHPGSTMIQFERGGKAYFGFLYPVDLQLMVDCPERIPSPFTNKAGGLTAPRAFNLMFKTYVGATASDDDVAYLRPETAQGIFIQFKNVIDTTRVGVPFGIAQTGKAFRNEVTPRNFTFRSREFEQMEIEFFCHPDEARDWYAFWRDWRMEWWQSLGLAGENLILREHDRDELAHYAKEGAGTSDVEYRFPFTAPGFGELEGVADRTDFDLRQHAEHSGLGDKLKYFDPSRGERAKNGQPKGERYFPHVIEPSAGLDRGVLAALCEAYTRDEGRASPEIMRFHPRLAPIKAAVFPLVKKDGMPEIAATLAGELRARFGHLGQIQTDDKQSIGKRYARMDEAGCPYCFTVDGETRADQAVTVRDRDTGGQERVGLDRAGDYLADKLGL